MNNGTIRALVFDFDGTLAEPSIDFAAMKRDLASLVRGYAPGASEAGDVPALEWLEAVAGELARTDAAAARRMTLAAHARIRAIEAEAASRTSLFPFTRVMLAEFAS